MRTLAVILFVLAALLGAFAYWGLYTRAGSARFDEMAGMIPFGAGIVSIVLLLSAAAMWWWYRPQ